MWRGLLCQIPDQSGIWKSKDLCWFSMKTMIQGRLEIYNKNSNSPHIYHSRIGWWHWRVFYQLLTYIWMKLNDLVSRNDDQILNKLSHLIISIWSILAWSTHVVSSSWIAFIVSCLGCITQIFFFTALHHCFGSEKWDNNELIVIILHVEVWQTRKDRKYLRLDRFRSSYMYGKL